MNEKFLNKNTRNYFIDTTYKIIPNKYKQYKMINITGVDSETNIIYLTALIIIKFEDIKFFEMVFKYLKLFIILILK